MNYNPPFWVKLISGILFISLLAFPAFMQQTANRPVEQVDDAAAKSYALDLFGFYLDDISSDVGIDFIHESPQLDPQLDHILPTIASMGAAVSVVDFNNDGWNDFYLTTSKYGRPNALYKNLGDGTFEEVAESLGVGNVNIEGTGVSMGSVWADFNNDGFEDLFLYKWGKPMLFQNNGGISFTDVSEKANLPLWVNSNSAIWLDYDNDGLR
ncbi:MAG: VCBS repeat-containing protein [Cyclobacteriaceae bacterium]|nr:VCBS repeat-containing protein [Cyclobacteriaceae bacterium]